MEPQVTIDMNYESLSGRRGGQLPVCHMTHVRGAPTVSMTVPMGGRR